MVGEKDRSDPVMFSPWLNVEGYDLDEDGLNLKGVDSKHRVLSTQVLTPQRELELGFGPTYIIYSGIQG